MDESSRRSSDGPPEGGPYVEVAPPLPPRVPMESGPPLRLPTPPTTFEKIKKLATPIVVVAVLLFKYGAKLKFAVPIIKFIPVILKTGGSMILTIGVYAMYWGVWFAVGFVLLILVHECGHLVAARRLGLKVGAPVFIPFMGAFIALQEAPKDAWIEAQVGIGGPLLGTLGAVACDGLYLLTGNPMFRALAYTGFFLNLFNLAPIGFLDGGRIVTALSPWLWLVGAGVVGLMLVTQFNFLLFVILLMSLPRLFSLFRKKSDEEKRYFEVTPGRRWAMAAMYFGLIGFLVMSMSNTRIDPPTTLMSAPTHNLARW
jgi:Zn-dependent protease